MFWMPETLPRYYDENRICNFAQGAFHMHIPGICTTTETGTTSSSNAGVVVVVAGVGTALHGRGGFV